MGNEKEKEPWSYGLSWFDKGTLLNLMAGVVLVALSIWLAGYFQIGPKFDLDMRGRATSGSVELLEDGDDAVYAIRYEHSSGAIYRMRYKGSLGVQRPDTIPGPIRVAYDPNDPGRFQPLGISYLPAAPIGVSFVMGMYFVFRSRRMVLRRARRDLGRKK